MLPSGRRAIAAAIFGLSAVTGGSAIAQAPAPARERVTMPSAAISHAEVRAIFDGAMAYATGLKLNMGIAVVDTAGDLIAAERMDGGTFRNVKFATGKAFAAAIFGQTTEDLGAVYKSRPDRYFGIMNMYPGKVYLVGGGVPLTLDGKLIGAVGVAGLPEGVDEKAGRAGIAAWMKMRETLKK